jgi:hypothetical protein
MRGDIKIDRFGVEPPRSEPRVGASSSLLRVPAKVPSPSAFAHQVLVQRLALSLIGDEFDDE